MAKGKNLLGLDIGAVYLYERGDENPYQKITLAVFDLDWLE